jgi:hypothetical protein
MMIRAMRGDGPKVERIPSGLEMQEIFANAAIARDDLTSDAERAMLYGDAEAYERLRAVDPR